MCTATDSDFVSSESSGVNLQFFSVEPSAPLRITLTRGDTGLLDETVQLDPINGNRMAAAIPDAGSGEPIRLTIRTTDGKELMAAETTVK